MGFFTRFFELRSDVSGLTNPESWLWEALGGKLTASGVRVNESTALMISAVWQCVMILAQNGGTLPLPVYKAVDSGPNQGRVKDRQHPLWKVLNRKSNPWMTAATYRMVIWIHLALWQVHYSHIERNGAGEVVALWPLHPDRTKPVVKGQKLVFETVLPDGTPKTLPANQVLHILGLTINGVEALPMIKMAREVLGLLMAMQEYGSRFFSNGANPGGFVSSDLPLTKDQKKQMAEDIMEQVKGLSKAHSFMVLSHGAKYVHMGKDPQNAQLLESRRFQIEEVGRWFNMPPHKLGLMDKGGASYASVEQQEIAFANQTLRPWLVIIEQAMNASLLSDAEQEPHTIEHVIEGLLRGDSKSRSEFYAKMFGIGALSINDIRALENKNSIGPAGDVYYVPLNMVPAEQAAKMDPQQRASLMQAAAALLSGERTAQAPQSEEEGIDA